MVRKGFKMFLYPGMAEEYEKLPQCSLAGDEGDDP